MARQSKRIVKSTAMLVMVLTIAGCKKSCEVVEKPSPTPSAVQLVGSGNSYVEITAAASAPLGGTGPCKDGMILAAAGNGTQQLLMGGVQPPWTTSYDLAGWDPKTEMFLSDPAGWQSKNTTKYKAMGDYMKGGYYFHNGTMNFVAVWPQVLATDASLQNSQVFMRIISLADSASPELQLEKMPGAKPAPKAKWTTGLETSPTPQVKP